MVVLGGTVLIQHLVQPTLIAFLLTAVLWVVAVGGFTFLSFRGTSLPSRGE